MSLIITFSFRIFNSPHFSVLHLQGLARTCSPVSTDLILFAFTTERTLQSKTRIILTAARCQSLVLNANSCCASCPLDPAAVPVDIRLRLVLVYIMADNVRLCLADTDAHTHTHTHTNTRCVSRWLSTPAM